MLYRGIKKIKAELGRGVIFGSLDAFLLLAVVLPLSWSPVPATAGVAGRAQPVATPMPPDVAVVVQRTTDGIPHLRADSWYTLGAGVGYVQAEDALCTLAEAFVTYAGERSLYFGADSRPQRDSTFGRPTNLELDFFFRAFADTEMVQRYRQQQPADLHSLLAGFAAGYNRYLQDARRQKSAAEPACLGQPWVRPIIPDDIVRRLYSAQVAAGYGHFIPEIVNAKPNQTGLAETREAGVETKWSLAARLRHSLGEQAGLGSNMMAFGRTATGENAAVLLGNPHWYWGGPDRFYQMHLTIPGRLDVAGVAFLGVPVIMIGFNERVAWTHTVSLARRFGLFDLTLTAKDPTRYLIDGLEETMTARTISVPVRDNKGGIQQISRQFHSSRFGPLVDLGAHDPALGWGGGHALALRDINAENFRVFRNYFYWNQAVSLDDFIAIQKRELAVPWANTTAIGRDDGRVWYGDLGPVPNVSEPQRAGCATDRSRAYAQADPQTPFLDGSRASCDWRHDRDAIQPGALAAAALPGLLREDYVANMNDSYWLSNAEQPLEGYSWLLGGERQALSLRGRLGHQMALELMAPATPAPLLSQRLMQAALTPRAYSAEQFKSTLLQQACAQAEVVLAATDSSTAPKSINLAAACALLTRWNNRADADARGALLWDAFWAELETIPESELFRVPFSAATPLSTPREPLIADGGAAQALARALVTFLDRGLDPAATLGGQRFVRSGQRHIPLFGACQSPGYFAVACNPAGYGGAASGDEVLGPDTIANSYLQVVHFDNTGVNAHTLLAHGLKETAVTNGPGSAPVERYASKRWLSFPFHQRQIDQDPGLKRWILRVKGYQEP